MIKYVHLYINPENGEIYSNKNQFKEYQKRKNVKCEIIQTERKSVGLNEIEIRHYYKEHKNNQLEIWT